jgi:cytochrome c oxidase subunit 4
MAQHSHAHDHSAHGAVEHHEESMVTNTIVFVLLLVLLAATYWAYRMDLGSTPNLIIALIIAVIKATMVLMVFMHVRLSSKLVWVFATAAFLWLVIMIAGFENDYMSRPMDGHDAHDFMSPEAAALKQMPT